MPDNIDIDGIKGTKVHLSVPSMIMIITLTASLTSIWWNFRTLESRMDKRYEREIKELRELEIRVKELEDKKGCG